MKTTLLGTNLCNLLRWCCTALRCTAHMIPISKQQLMRRKVLNIRVQTDRITASAY